MAKTTEPKAVLERTYNVPLRREYLKAPRYKRVNRAVSALRSFIQRHMKSDDVKIGKYANLKLWENGIKNPPHHLKINAVKYDTGLVVAELVGAPTEEKKPKKAKKKAEPKEEEKAPAAKKKAVKKEEEKPAAKKKTAEETSAKTTEEKPAAKKAPAKTEPKAEEKKPAAKKKAATTEKKPVKKKAKKKSKKKAA